MRADYLISLALSEDRLPALRKKWSGINTSHDYRWEMDEVPQKHRKSAAFDVVTMDMDPTENKQYSDRLLHFYHQGQIAADDADEVRKTVSLFHDHKHLMPEKDINKYDTEAPPLDDDELASSDEHATSAAPPAAADERAKARMAERTEVRHWKRAFDVAED
jgi:hypothetical protein